MITSVRLINFKNFADETLKLGPFTVIVGANASGKSNIRDAFRFLHGIGRGYTLAEIIGGRFGVGGRREWDPLRGAPNEVIRINDCHRSRHSLFSINTQFDTDGIRSEHSIEIERGSRSTEGFLVLDEWLNAAGKSVFVTESATGSDLNISVEDYSDEAESTVTRTQPALTQIRLHRVFRSSKFAATEEVVLMPREVYAVRQQLAKMRFFDLNTDRLREPSIPGAITIGDFGENLPSALEALCNDVVSKDVLVSWLRELTPMDVKDFEFPRDLNGNVNLEIVEHNGSKVSALSASDGTLRFLAMLAIMLGPEPASLYFFEEINNGIHPSRLSLLVELIERQTDKRGFQVVTTTHSPELLTMVSDETFESTAVVYRDEESERGIVRQVADLPNARQLRKTQGLGRLFSSRWMENVLAFDEYPDDEVPR